MALSVQAPNNPTKISGVIQATPGSNGFATLAQPAPLQLTTAPSVSSNNGGGGGSSTPAPVYAPALDTNAIYGQASQTASGLVNPIYSKYLNDFIGQQNQAKTLQQQQTATDIANLQDVLANTNAANATTGTRAAEDTSLAEGKINTAADQRQTDQGTQNTLDRNAEAVKLAGSGLTGSGLATGQQATSEQTHLTTETRQGQADQEAKDAAELTKARTFEDLATSGKLAQTTETKGEAQSNFDLNRFIVGQSADLQNKQNDLEQQRTAAVEAETKRQQSQLVQNFINSIANPAQRQAAYQAYGGYL